MREGERKEEKEKFIFVWGKFLVCNNNKHQLWWVASAWPKEIQATLKSREFEMAAFVVACKFPLVISLKPKNYN